MKKIHFLILSILLSSNFWAQTIRLDFPHFAGKEYAFWLFAGDTKDTIATGKLDDKGKTTLTIPAKYKSYAGMSQWMLTDGGGLNMIINGENFSVSCASPEPNDTNIVYSGSSENNIFRDQYKRQQELFQKIDGLRIASQSYTQNEAFYPVITKELARIESQFTPLQTQIAQSPLYAARFRQIVDFLMGIGDQLYTSEEEKAKALAGFAANKLDLDALYTSNHWDDLLTSWMQMHTQVLKDDSLLLADTRTMLSRIVSDTVYTAFAEKISALYTKYGKDELLDELAVDLARSGRLRNAGAYLQHLTTAPKNSIAPSLIGLEENNNSFIGNTTLLVFYQSGCGSCANEMRELKTNYEKLREKGVHVISVSSDKDKDVFAFNSTDLPWTDKLCDLRGLQGDNFKNYGVIGTPTFFVIDNQGKIKGRYARLVDTGLINN